jgi:hypothetical protein
VSRVQESQFARVQQAAEIARVERAKSYGARESSNAPVGDADSVGG